MCSNGHDQTHAYVGRLESVIGDDGQSTLSKIQRHLHLDHNISALIGTMGSLLGR